MLQTGSMLLIFIFAMGIGPAIGFIYLGVGLLIAHAKKMLTE